MVLPEHIFIGEVEGKLVCSVALELKKLPPSEEVYLKTGGIAGVYTDSDFRTKDISTNLMKRAPNYTKQSSVSNSVLFADLDIPAHRIYFRLGFLRARDTNLFSLMKNLSSWGKSTLTPILWEEEISFSSSFPSVTLSSLFLFVTSIPFRSFVMARAFDSFPGPLVRL